jgi:hypothetical protein
MHNHETDLGALHPYLSAADAFPDLSAAEADATVQLQRIRESIRVLFFAAQHGQFDDGERINTEVFAIAARLGLALDVAVKALDTPRASRTGTGFGVSLPGRPSARERELRERGQRLVA